ncbi:MAG: DUF2169 domain-containing protein [Sandaracinaceae bacterium]
MSGEPSFFVPEPRLEAVQNRTPFALFRCDKMGVGRRFFDTVVVKGTFVLAPGPLRLADEQDPIALADEPWDESAPERSSLRVAGDVVLTKPSTDVLVTGTARAPSKASEWDVRVAVARGGSRSVDRRFRVTGPRSWVRRDGEWTLTDAEPTDAVPVRYELAYGGAYVDEAQHTPEDDLSSPWVVHRPNPSGTGFVDERSLPDDAEVRAPQWLDPKQWVDPAQGLDPDAGLAAPNAELALAGFGPIARPWASRIGFAGTYDAAWLSRTRQEIERGLPPDYAADFDPRFFQCAHPDLITKEHLRGDEEIALEGLTPGALTLRLPACRVLAHMLDGRNQAHEERMPLDTVHVDLDRERVHLTWRLTLDQARDVRAAIVLATEDA